MTSEGANSGGVDGVSINRDFECFDQLPKSLRRTLANAHSKYCSVQLFNLWARKAMTAKEIIGEIKMLNQRAERDLKKKINKANANA